MERRNFLFLLLVIISISLFTNLILEFGNTTQDNTTQDNTTQDQLSAHTAKAIVITCMDFRLIDDAVRYLDRHGYNNNYDEFILAGASLGYNQTTYSAWTETLDTHIGLAQQLHDIKEIIVIDHMNCGAYKILYNKDSLTEDKELALHKQNFKIFKNTIKQKYPTLRVRTLLMKLNGEVVEL